MELYVYGPAFGLLSADADCIGATALLSQAFKPDEWTLVIANDTPISLLGDLPALRHDNHWYAGYQAIKRHLDEIRRSGDSDASLNAEQQVTAVGLSNHIRSRALPLLDTHLYTITNNYIQGTRPAFSRFLPFPFAWSLPSRRYERASNRAEPLGLTTSSYFSSTVAPPSGNEPAMQPEIASSTSPSLLFARGQAAQASLQKQAQTAHFRLEGAVDALCAPMDALLRSNTQSRGDEDEEGAERLLLSEGGAMTSTDYLAYGYLSLLLFAEVPERGVEELIRKRWGRTVRYVEQLRGRLVEQGLCKVDAAKVQGSAPVLGQGVPYSSGKLRYAIAPSPTFSDRARALMTHVVTLFVPSKTLHSIYDLFTCPSPPLLTLLVTGSSIGAAALITAAQILLAGKNKDKPVAQTMHVFRATPRALSTLGLGSGMGEAGRILAEGFRMGGLGR